MNCANVKAQNIFKQEISMKVYRMDGRFVDFTLRLFDRIKFFTFFRILFHFLRDPKSAKMVGEMLFPVLVNRKVRHHESFSKVTY